MTRPTDTDRVQELTVRLERTMDSSTGTSKALSSGSRRPRRGLRALLAAIAILSSLIGGLVLLHRQVREREHLVAVLTAMGVQEILSEPTGLGQAVMKFSPNSE